MATAEDQVTAVENVLREVASYAPIARILWGICKSVESNPTARALMYLASEMQTFSRCNSINIDKVLGIVDGMKSAKLDDSAANAVQRVLVYCSLEYLLQSNNLVDSIPFAKSILFQSERIQDESPHITELRSCSYIFFVDSIRVGLRSGKKAMEEKASKFKNECPVKNVIDDLYRSARMTAKTGDVESTGEKKCLTEKSSNSGERPQDQLTPESQRTNSGTCLNDIELENKPKFAQKSAAEDSRSDSVPLRSKPYTGIEEKSEKATPLQHFARTKAIVAAQNDSESRDVRYQNGIQANTQHSKGITENDKRSPTPSPVQQSSAQRREPAAGLSSPIIKDTDRVCRDRHIEGSPVDPRKRRRRSASPIRQRYESSSKKHRGSVKDLVSYAKV